MIEALLLAVTRVTTMLGEKTLTNATGFFFERDKRLYLITSRHVVLDKPSEHFPDRLEIELHVDPENAADTVGFSIPLYKDRKSIWLEGFDSAGPVDVVALELERAVLPKTLWFQAFTPAHLVERLEQVELGASVLIVGFPLGVHDELHRLPVARQAAIASAFGIRFQGKGYFLTDARLHRGTSGAPVVTRETAPRAGRADLAWRLLGIHASRLDIANRDVEKDEALDLNCAWYADILMTLTQPPGRLAVRPPA
ncbi:MAG TPA: serine protease [Burkholderiales bacterium]|nr:serine protease [Burkholderiales bacterium]